MVSWNVFSRSTLTLGANSEDQGQMLSQSIYLLIYGSFSSSQQYTRPWGTSVPRLAIQTCPIFGLFDVLEKNAGAKIYKFFFHLYATF